MLLQCIILGIKYKLLHDFVSDNIMDYREMPQDKASNLNTTFLFVHQINFRLGQQHLD